MSISISMFLNQGLKKLLPHHQRLTQCPVSWPFILTEVTQFHLQISILEDICDPMMRFERSVIYDYGLFNLYIDSSSFPIAEWHFILDVPPFVYPFPR